MAANSSKGAGRYCLTADVAAFSIVLFVFSRFAANALGLAHARLGVEVHEFLFALRFLWKVSAAIDAHPEILLLIVTGVFLLERRILIGTTARLVAKIATVAVLCAMIVVHSTGILLAAPF